MVHAVSIVLTSGRFINSETHRVIVGVGHPDTEGGQDELVDVLNDQDLPGEQLRDGVLAGL